MAKTLMWLYIIVLIVALIGIAFIMTVCKPVFDCLNWPDECTDMMGMFWLGN